MTTLALHRVEIVRVFSSHEPTQFVWMVCSRYAGPDLSADRSASADSYEAAILVAAALPAEIQSEFTP